MTYDLRSIRPLPKESLRGIVPADVSVQKLPELAWVDPRDIHVEASYQRAVGDKGSRLIRKIVAGFSWARFKPPACIRHPESGTLLCIDGQHTATAAASHPGIDKIPVMIVEASSFGERADAFVGHNRDRVALTAMAIYRAELAGGDATAGIIERACKASGANILLHSVNLRERQPVGSTIAIGTIRIVAQRRGEAGLTAVLRLLVGAGRGPIKAGEISAVDRILAQYPAMADKLLEIVKSRTTEQWAAVAAMEQSTNSQRGTRVGEVLATLWCRELGVPLQAEPKANPAPKPAPRAAPPRPPAPPVARPAAPPRPEPRLEPPQRAQQAPTAPQDAAKSVQYNGIAFTVGHDCLGVRFRGKAITINRKPDAQAVLALARVMPAMLDFSRVERAAYGKVDGDTPGLRSVLVERVNAVLRQVGLEIKTIPKMGHTLYDLGPGQRE